jgi:hypothetical protein
VTVICNNCGAANRPAARFCNQCDRSLACAPRAVACAACRAGAGDDPAAARLLYERVIGVIEGQLGLRVHRRPGFGLYSRADMDLLEQAVLGLRVHRRPGFGLYSRADMDLLEQAVPPPARPALSGHLIGAYIKLGRRREIVVETGLPRLLMSKVIAHEYAHAWQGENCAFPTDAQLSEGFCEWVAYKVPGALGAGDV